MRVYEFAKKHKISSKQALAMLEEGGFNIANHMAMLDKEATDFLTKKLAAASVPEKAASKIPGQRDDKQARKKSEKSVPTPKLRKNDQIEGDDDDEAPASDLRIKGKDKEPAKKQVRRVIKDDDDENEDAGIQVEQAPSLASGDHVKHPGAQPFLKSVSPGAPLVIELAGELPLYQVAERLRISSGELIISLMKKGRVCNRNYLLSPDDITQIAREFGAEVREAPWVQDEKIKQADEGGEVRWPVVVVMGHVDHGKTTLLDYVRHANVASREKGGITQHLGAYLVESTHGKIAFLDTPGHEAFSLMRKRGARVTDIAVLVVAADDGVMPQTVEAITHAKEVGVPIVVAINKMDRPGAIEGAERVKRQLAEQGLVPEDWGGDTVCVPISAQSGEGVNELLEMIVLQAELLELRAYTDRPARSFVLESHMRRGLGPVAVVIGLEGTLRVGDYFVCGKSKGRVRVLIDEHGKRIDHVGPSMPVCVVGFNDIVSSGDVLRVVLYEEYAKYKGDATALQKPITQIQHTETLLIVKADTFGSKEAVLGAIGDISVQSGNDGDQLSFSVISEGVGDIIESDVEFARDTGAVIVAYYTKVDRKAALLAEVHGVRIVEESVIYHLLGKLKEVLDLKKKPITELKKVGEGVVLRVFNIKGVGVVAGGAVQKGIFSRNGIVKCMRDGQAMGEGKISSLQREKRAVKEVHTGLEFAIMTPGFQDWHEGDVVECYVEEVVS